MTQKTKGKTNIQAKNLSNKKIRPSIKKEAVHPVAYNKYKLPWACEDCVHYNGASATDEEHTTKEHDIDARCTLGYLKEPHLRKNLEKSYELSGKISLCRFLEID